MSDGIKDAIKRLKTKASPYLEYGKNAEGTHQVSGGLSVSKSIGKKVNLRGEVNQSFVSDHGYNEFSKPTFKAGVSVNLGSSKKEEPKKKINL